MAYTNSPLVNMTRISPNRNSPRNQPISKITIHHMAGVNSIETFANIVASPAREMSSNYGIGNDGRIVLTCPESDRSWCSSSPLNDHRAITIEVSNSAVGGDWPIGNAAYNSLIKLCVDICKRNGIKKLYFDGTPNGSLTFHYMFDSTACPGPWIKARAQEICNKVNAQLNATTDSPKPTPSTTTFKVGDLVKINAGARYYNGGAIPVWVTQEKWYISSISGDRAVLGLNEAKNRNIQSPIYTKDITLIKTTSTNTSTFKSYTKSFGANETVYDNPGGKKVGTIGSAGVFTIVEEKTVNGTVYGKLKSGKGWVVVKASEIKKGDRVKVLNPIVYGTNKKFTVYVSVYTVLEVSGDRVVISSDGKNVTTAIAKSNLQKV